MPRPIQWHISRVQRGTPVPDVEKHGTTHNPCRPGRADGTCPGASWCHGHRQRGDGIGRVGKCYTVGARCSLMSACLAAAAARYGERLWAVVEPTNTSTVQRRGGAPGGNGHEVVWRIYSEHEAAMGELSMICPSMRTTGTSPWPDTPILPRLLAAKGPVHQLLFRQGLGRLQAGHLEASHHHRSFWTIQHEKASWRAPSGFCQHDGVLVVESTWSKHCAALRARSTLMLGFVCARTRLN